jgi:hypothetical protein
VYGLWRGFTRRSYQTYPNTINQAKLEKVVLLFLDKTS